MQHPDDALQAWEARLRQQQEDLDERERQALADHPTPAEVLALAAERERLAQGHDAAAQVHDDRATSRDLSSLDRDTGGSERDRRARGASDDADPGFGDRFLAGADRDLAAGDRSDSLDDRVRSSDARRRAAQDRQRAATDRAQAARQAEEQERELDGLRTALETRLTIGRAEGLLMERHGLTADAAFAVLARHSQETNRKLRDIAALFVADAEASNAEASSRARTQEHVEP